MHKDRLNKFIGTRDISIVEAMQRIDANSRGILFITDENGALAGTLTDGDIRRHLLGAGELTAPVSKAMKTTPKYLFVEQKDQAKQVMERDSIKAIPILDGKRSIVDIVLLYENDAATQPAADGSLAGVPVVIMAGGKGTRLYPYTKILPKPLIPIGDTPIVERILNQFHSFGTDKFYMTVNYKKGMIKSYFADLQPDYEIAYVEEAKPLGTGGSIRLIEEPLTQPVIVANCDALVRADYNDLYRLHKESGNDITMVSALKNITIPYGVLKSGKDGELLGIEEKPTLSYFINTGMYVINPETIKLIPKDTMFHMTELVEKVMQNGGKVGTYPVSEDSFLDMGEFSEMKRMEEKLQIVSQE